MAVLFAEWKCHLVAVAVVVAAVSDGEVIVGFAALMAIALHVNFAGAAVVVAAAAIVVAVVDDAAALNDDAELVVAFVNADFVAFDNRDIDDAVAFVEYVTGDNYFVVLAAADVSYYSLSYRVRFLHANYLK